MEASMRSAVRFQPAAVGAVVALVAAVTACRGPVANGNLTWTGPKEYDPVPIDTVFVENLGVDDTVHVLPGSVPFSVQRAATNADSGAIAAGYLVRERIIRWVFQSVGGNVGWVRGDTATSVVYVDSVAGPALAAGASAPVAFDSIPALQCGLYEEELLLDVGATVTESDEGDNIARHFFFVPSPQRFNVVLDTLDNELFHAVAATPTYRFNVRPLPGAPGNPVAFISGFSTVIRDGSTVTLDRALPVPVPPGGAAVVMIVDPTEHAIATPLSPQVEGKLTVISADGCILDQTSATVLIEHG
jgi:hypothetical protein